MWRNLESASTCLTSGKGLQPWSQRCLIFCNLGRYWYLSTIRLYGDRAEPRWEIWATPCHLTSLLGPLSKILGRGRSRCIEKVPGMAGLLAMVFGFHALGWPCPGKPGVDLCGALWLAYCFLHFFWLFHWLPLRGLWLLHPCWGLSHGFPDIQLLYYPVNLPLYELPCPGCMYCDVLHFFFVYFSKDVHPLSHVHSSAHWDYWLFKDNNQAIRVFCQNTQIRHPGTVVSRLVEMYS